MGRSSDTLGDLDVIVKGRGCFHILFERAIHHHRGKAMADRREARRIVIAVILVHHNGDMRVHLGEGLYHMAQHNITGIGSGAAASL